MDMTLLLSFIGVAVLLTLMPGPDILFVIAQSISQDRKAGIIITVGLCTGLMIHVSAAAIGISTLIYQSAVAFTIVKYAGAAYLIYLAWQAFKEKDAGFMIDNQQTQQYKSLYKKGVIMNILNPKVSLFFIALLPQFVDSRVGNVTVQMFILGIIFIIQAFVIMALVSFLSNKVRIFLMNNPFLGKRINQVKGTLLGLIGLQIAISDK
ncbi:LysE family translocator [Chengkuizengella axinellae]|uniref:LysE family translocator n=1 Tax=Chengkuizengella axinellae TaxID=3064388 RepID=A0ABT9IU83_9BACL|nr:LysE family translocator [Chengkuizengella sp. 2205SS18-9]MDP5272911.1 LysE family translocator [Chengkuizengella sp. 2205SS18-9]